ncbi:MAG: SpoIIE family protein phosphatase [Candidatus Wallbacteria bacterium]|nr:SpoIIE family protein phosphatase [Candidatus Wallbacteria bacterium]
MVKIFLINELGSAEILVQKDELQCFKINSGRFQGNTLSELGIAGFQPDVSYFVDFMSEKADRIGLLVSDEQLSPEQTFEQKLELLRRHFRRRIEARENELRELERSLDSSMQAMTDLYEELSALYDLAKLTGKKIVTFYDVDQLLREILYLVSESGLFKADGIVISTIDDSTGITSRIAGWDKESNAVIDMLPTHVVWEKMHRLVEISVNNKHSLLYPGDGVPDGLDGKIDSFVLVEPIFTTENKRLGAILVYRSYEEISEKLRNFLSVIGSQVSLIISLGNTFQEILNKKKMERELELAADIQKKLLPKKHPFVMGWDIYGKMSTARVVGGDYFDYFLDDRERNLSVIIADVSGKGISAALVMATFRGILRTVFSESVEIRTVIEKLNNTLRDDVEGEKFVTLFLIKIDLQTGEAHYIKAGHNPPLFFKSSENMISKMEGAGLFLGMFDDLMLEVINTSIGMQDALLLYTDGAIELVNQQDEEYGIDKLKLTFQESLSEIMVNSVCQVFSQIENFKGTGDWFDDVTLIGIRRSPFTIREAAFSSDYHELRSFSCNLQKELETEYPDIIQSEDCYNLRLIVDELVTNAIQHGNKKDPNRKVKITCKSDHRGIHLIVCDEGDGFNWQEEMRQAQVINIYKTRDRGMLICLNLSESFYYSKKGNEAHLALYWRKYEKNLTG